MATTTNWSIDPSHSEIAFKVKHLMISNVKGVFSEFKAEVQTEKYDFATALVNFVMNPASINTGSPDRDAHLKSPDFFDVENHKEITFKSESLKKVDGDQFVMSGDLTIKGVTGKVGFKVEFGGLMTDPWGNEKAGFSLSGKINRRDFGLTWNAALETGGVLVGEDVHISADVELLRQA